ncbi:hypothetical protein BpHYR1_046542 [Brachionus plicatilis]|uniref:Uncharacterized protein n=1 Tax=Brachionus plicatilis TaxID=10195 RepID=A0A3M7RFJ7_BRAPC|nr:hypothetical protein BpHYR1_046542 [Brachionus plicatilis]
MKIKKKFEIFSEIYENFFLAKKREKIIFSLKFSAFIQKEFGDLITSISFDQKVKNKKFDDVVIVIVVVVNIAVTQSCLCRYSLK